MTAPKLMDGYDPMKVSIDDTGLGDWATVHENTTDQGQLGEIDTITEGKQAKSTTENNL